MSAAIEAANAGHNAVFDKAEFAPKDWVRHLNHHATASIDALQCAAGCEAFADDLSPVFGNDGFRCFFADFVALKAIFNQGAQIFGRMLTRPGSLLREIPEIRNQVFDIA